MLVLCVVKAKGTSQDNRDKYGKSTKSEQDEEFGVKKNLGRVKRFLFSSERSDRLWVYPDSYSVWTSVLSRW